MCGWGSSLTESQLFKLKLNCGQGTNSKVELLDLWCLCKVALTFGLDAIEIFGDSQVIIN